MRLRELRKLIEQLSTGGGQLDYGAAVTTEIDPGGQGTNGTVEPLNPSITTLVLASMTIGSIGGCGIDVDGVTVAYSDVEGQVVVQAEVPPGSSYSVYRNNSGSHIDNVIEVPRG